jgi:MFS family permease
MIPIISLQVPFIYLKGVAIVGIANTVGRVISGWVADRPGINVLFFNNASVTIIGLSTVAVPFLNSFNALVLFACTFGLAMGL